LEIEHAISNGEVSKLLPCLTAPSGIVMFMGSCGKPIRFNYLLKI
jgi:hypothetical protein